MQNTDAPSRPAGLAQPPSPPTLHARWATIAGDLAGLRSRLLEIARGIIDQEERGPLGR